MARTTLSMAVWCCAGLIALAACTESPKFDTTADASGALAIARKDAAASGRYLMVVFGADWCPDCLKLYANLKSQEVEAYMQDHMDFVTIDVGDKDRNIDVAAELGVTVANGIPVAVFFNPDGSSLGTTNNGQLEPSRHFTSKQILRFVQAVVEQRQVTSPKAHSTPNPENSGA